MKYALAGLALAVGLTGSVWGLEHRTSDTPRIDSPKHKMTKKLREPANWQIQLWAENPAEGLAVEEVFLGRLHRKDAKKRMSSSRRDSESDGALTLYLDPSRGMPEAHYTRLYHGPKRRGLRDRWTFTVVSEDPNAEIVLRWRGLYLLKPYRDADGRKRYRLRRTAAHPFLMRMKLIDLESGTEIPAVIDGRLAHYRFTMDGRTTRRFKWVVQKRRVSLDLSAEERRRLTSFSVSAAKRRATSPENEPVRKHPRFDLDRPPMTQEGGRP